MWSFYLAVVIVAKVALGAIYDRWGMRAGTILGTITSVLAGVMLLFPATDWGLACSSDSPPAWARWRRLSWW
ncbi:MAG: hypothetical protein V8R48_00440 [Eggerthella lenta]